MSATNLPKQITNPPPAVPNTDITFPAPHVLLVTLNRPKALNAIPIPQHIAMTQLWNWFDSQPWLRCAILTGTGRAFCAGADLKEWDSSHAPDGAGHDAHVEGRKMTTAGFGGLSNRSGGKKPIIAAVNGLCFGGGMEMVINCDLVVADGAKARFGLPEVGKGVIALAGALPRLMKTVGRQRASEMALMGRVTYRAEEMKGWGLVNFVVPEGQVVEEAVKVAEEIAGNSPDAVIASREGLKLGWEGVGPEVATDILERGLYGRIDAGENMKEGVRSFVEKRRPKWVDSKL
ncbi:putative enoyl-CoA hydratase/carnithine racemase [Triangularia verruculosa]|uniref:Enoyl-CoA hydratase/carnithine racemase n=1 Tax=Triangularia verruculosa TaxID=2587418 RepID=A0AAN6XH04_9PEZI|nr:putative enoyl-CoA hydratase/carnithine racemase [Triangularia verruculosa]